MSANGGGAPHAAHRGSAPHPCGSIRRDGVGGTDGAACTGLAVGAVRGTHALVAQRSDNSVLASTRGETFVALLVLELGFAHRTHRYLAVLAIGLPGSMAAQLAAGRLAGHESPAVFAATLLSAMRAQSVAAAYFAVRSASPVVADLRATAQLAAALAPAVFAQS